MEGFLFKKGRGDSSFGRRNWKKRWFALEGSELSYYENFNLATDEPTIIKGTANIEKCTCVPITHREKQNTFVISPKQGHEMQLHAADSKTMNLWIKEINAAARGERQTHVINYKECYEILGLYEEDTPSASEINRAYRKAALKHHPDKGGDLQEFEKIQAAFNSLMNKLEEEEFEAQHDTVTYQVLLKKQAGDTGLGLVVEEDTQKHFIKIKSVMSGIEIHSISSQAQGVLLPGDILLKVRSVEVLHMPLTRVAQKLNHYRVPVNTTVNLTFIRKVKKAEFISHDDDFDDEEGDSKYQSIDTGSESNKFEVNSATMEKENNIPFSHVSETVAEEEKVQAAIQSATINAPPTSSSKKNAIENKYPELSSFDPVRRVAIVAENEELKDEVSVQKKTIDELQLQLNHLKHQVASHAQQVAKKQQFEQERQIQLYSYVYSGTISGSPPPGTIGRYTNGMKLTKSEIQQSMQQLLILSKAIEDLIEQGYSAYKSHVLTSPTKSKSRHINEVFRQYSTPEMEQILSNFDVKYADRLRSDEELHYAERTALLSSFLSDSQQTIIHQHLLSSSLANKKSASGLSNKEPFEEYSAKYLESICSSFRRLEMDLISKLSKSELLTSSSLNESKVTKAREDSNDIIDNIPIVAQSGPILLNPTMSSTAVASIPVSHAKEQNHFQKPNQQYIPLGSANNTNHISASQAQNNPNDGAETSHRGNNVVPQTNSPVRIRSSSHSVSSVSMLSSATSTLAMPKVPLTSSRFLQPTASSNQRRQNNSNT